MDQTVIILIGLVGLIALWLMKYRPQQAIKARGIVQTQGVAHSTWQTLPADIREQILEVYDQDGADAALQLLRKQVKLPATTARSVMDLIHMESLRRRRDTLLAMAQDQAADS